MYGIEGELGYVGAFSSRQCFADIRYVVPPASLQDLAPVSQSHLPAKPDPKVNIGIFPASVTHIRPGAINDDGTLADAFALAVRQAEDAAEAQSIPPPWARELEGVKEEDEEVEGYSVASPGMESSHRGEVVDVFSSPTNRTSTPKGAVRNRPKSLLVDTSRLPSSSNKAQPPVPTITAGDSTVAGQVWPLVDEIACAIREWHEVRRSMAIS